MTPGIAVAQKHHILPNFDAGPVNAPKVIQALYWPFPQYYFTPKYQFPGGRGGRRQLAETAAPPGHYERAYIHMGTNH